MGKITGMERMEELPEKVLQLYQAVVELIMEGEDMNHIKVSMITQRAGIGKGTAYDYFDSKEEIITCAIAFFVRKMTREVHEGVKQYDTFAEQLNYLMDRTQERLGEQQCFVRFVHMMTDTSALSVMLREKIEMEHLERYLPLDTLEEILRTAIMRGEIREDLPMDYMVYSICARLITYMAAINIAREQKTDAERMRPYIYQGILDEFQKR